MNKENKFLGYMHIDKRPYKELAKTVSRWIKRGDVVKRIIRYENDFFPEMICYLGYKECEVE